jgi:hypothetical protein
MSPLKLFFACMAFVGVVAATYSPYTSFTCDIAITNDPSVWGGLTGRLSYYYDTSGKAQHYRSIVYTVTGGQGTYTEIVNASDESRMLKCGTSCQAEYFSNKSFDKFVYDSTTDSSTASSSYPGCALSFTRADYTDIKYVYTSANKQLCAVKYSTGKTITFSNYNFTQLTPSSSVFYYGNWGCAAKVCNVIMDLVIVFDESTSIAATDWTSDMTFGKTLSSSFTISTTAVNIGVVSFSDNVRIRGALTGNAAQIQQSYFSFKRVDGYTCIGCGLYGAAELLNNSLRPSLHPTKVVVLITDGQNNMPSWDYEDYLQAAAKVVKKTLGAVVFAVGVGDEISDSDMEIIATNPSYIIPVGSFSALNTLINTIVSSTCQNYPDEPCGSSCRGFCACSRTCVCPSCLADNKCTNTACTAGVNMNGCTPDAVDCNDNKACTDDLCSNSTGCYYQTHSCDDSNLCTVDSCDNVTGCSNKAIVCPTPTNLCLESVCTDPLVGCQSRAKVCDDNDPCTNNTCNSKVGCLFPQIVCDDGLACTDDVCTNGVCSFPQKDCASLATDPVCHPGTCDTTLGCVFKQKNCADSSPCTNDYCVSTVTGGCVHENITGCALCAFANCTVNNKCEVAVCTEDSAKATCGIVSWKDDSNFGCSSNDPCIQDFCDNATGTCSHNSLYLNCSLRTDAPLCKGYQCVDGQCVLYDITCVPQDSCHNATCDITTGLCKQSDACPKQTCSIMSCTSDSTSHTCHYDTNLSHVCPTGNDCLVPKCDADTGACSSETRVCNDNDFCTLDLCATSGGCYYPPNPCDDSNMCTNDTCTNNTCHNTAICNDHLFCTDDVCSVDTQGNVGCTYVEHSCNLNLSDVEASCYIAKCSEHVHCYKATIRGAFTNPCGDCVGQFAGENDSTTCYGDISWPKLAGALAGGIVAGIVIAAVVGFLIFAGASAFGTWKLVQMSKAGKGMAAHNNPMYKPSDHESVNPAYAQR